MYMWLSIAAHYLVYLAYNRFMIPWCAWFFTWFLRKQKNIVRRDKNMRDSIATEGVHDPWKMNTIPVKKEIFKFLIFYAALYDTWNSSSNAFVCCHLIFLKGTEPYETRRSTLLLCAAPETGRLLHSQLHQKCIDSYKSVEKRFSFSWERLSSSLS